VNAPQPNHKNLLPYPRRNLTFPTFLTVSWRVERAVGAGGRMTVDDMREASQVYPLATLAWSRIALESVTPSIHTHSPRTPQARERAVGAGGRVSVW
jgi:hypothetical protein